MLFTLFFFLVFFFIIPNTFIIYKSNLIIDNEDDNLIHFFAPVNEIKNEIHDDDYYYDDETYDDDGFYDKSYDQIFYKNKDHNVYDHILGCYFINKDEFKQK